MADIQSMPLRSPEASEKSQFASQRTVLDQGWLRAVMVKRSTPLSPQVFAQMKAEGVQPTAVTYGCLMNACESAGRIEGAMALYQEACDSSITPTDECHNILINLFAKSGRSEPGCWSGVLPGPPNEEHGDVSDQTNQRVAHKAKNGTKHDSSCADSRKLWASLKGWAAARASAFRPAPSTA